MKQRAIYQDVWRDDIFVSLSANSQKLYLYTLTSPNLKLIPVYKLSDREITFDTSLSGKNLLLAKRDISKLGVFFKEGYCILKTKYAVFNYKGSLLEEAKQSQWSEIPQNVQLEYKSDTLSEGYVYPTEGVSDNDSNNDNENDSDNKREILKKFNEVLGKNYTSTKAWESNYKKWLEDFKYEDVLRAIENIPKHSWLRDKDVTPTMFFRTDKDWIEQCLNLQTKKKSALDKYNAPQDTEKDRLAKLESMGYKLKTMD